MSRLHSTLVAVVLGAVAATGLFAMVRTLRLGQTVSVAKPALIARELAARQAKLAHWSRSLREARAKRPPALPKLPKFAPVHVAPAAPPAAPTASTAPQAAHVQPRAVVKYRHASAPHTSTGSSTPSSSDDGSSDDGSGDDSSGGGD